MSIRPLALAALAALATAGSSAAAQGLSFTDVTDAAGLTTLHRAPPALDDPNFDWHTLLGGCAAGDFDRDGCCDLWVAGGGRGPDRLFFNNGDGTFTDRAEAWGLSELHVAGGAATGDFDDDGWLDLFVASMGPAPATGPGRHKLWRNTGGGGFVDVARQAGVNATSPQRADGFGATFGDYDLDGDLDLCVLGWHQKPTMSRGNRLFRNEGDGTFTDVTVQAGILAPWVYGFSPWFCDMNGDRYPELLLAADFGTSRYYANLGDGTFADVSDASGTGLDENGMGAAVGDLDGDGRIDWYVTSIWDPSGQTFGGSGNKLYLNQGGHTYIEVAAAAGVDQGFWGWGTAAADLDQDGRLDLVENNGWKSLGALFHRRPARLWLNEGNGAFSESSAATGLVDHQDGRALCTLDADGDSDLDVVLYANRGWLRLFRNDVAGPSAHALRIDLDTRARPDLAPHGVGSLVEIEVAGQRSVRPATWGSQYLAQSQMTLHFGLGTAAVVDRLTVTWPDGATNVWTDVPADRVLLLAPE